MAISINDIKAGLTILLNNQLYLIMGYQHVKPGKGGAFMRTKLRNLKDGAILEKTFKGDEKLQEAFIEERKLQYLYRADKIYHFIDQENFEETSISDDILGENVKFLKDNLQITAYSYQGEIFNVVLPNFIHLKVIHSEPGIKGDTAKSVTKQAILETNASVNVPLFVKVDDVIKIDTRSGQYIERV